MKRTIHAFAISLLVTVLLVSCSAPPTEPDVEDSSPTPTLIADETAVSTAISVGPQEDQETPTEEVQASPQPTSLPTPTPVPPPFQDVSIMGLDLTGTNFSALSETAAEAGAYWIRSTGVQWSQVEPNQGDRNWEALSELENSWLSLTENNLKLIALVTQTPAWAQDKAGISCGPIAPEALTAFGDFMYDLVSRYSGEPYNVKYWEMGNEPDIAFNRIAPDSPYGCWGDEAEPFFGGEYYAEMLKAIYARVKEADPEAQVLVGGLVLDCDPIIPVITNSETGATKDCTSSLFVEGILKNGGGDYFDGISYHAYDYYDPTSGYFGNGNWHSGYTLSGLIPIISPKTQFLKSVLGSYGILNQKYLINTETALLCIGDGSSNYCVSPAFNDMKADYVAMSYATAKSESIEGNLWYTFAADWRKSYLISPGGPPTKSYFAFEYAADRFSDTTYWGSVSEFPGVYGYKFKNSSQETWVVWSLNGDTVPVTFDSLPNAVHSVIGDPITPTLNFEITSSPIYIDWLP